ncbi:MAG: F0F1 ATP synthase subunit A [Candidatus Omnitrophica bacterium]|nr:F0F1 ATP synthase subunit A [Candidatus Omnitrophota bacterium]
MTAAKSEYPEFPNIISILGEHFHAAPFGRFLLQWENLIYAFLVMGIITLFAFLATRKMKPVPGRLQAAAELLVGFIDDFVCMVIGPSGRKYTPFIGTLFLYIITMNLIGYIPFLKSPSADWSITLALALCVFVYVEFDSLRELGFVGYVDHMMGRPRGVLAFTVILPAAIFALHMMAEVLRPLTLSLRLRSNIWGDDMLLALLAGFGFQGLPLMLFSMFLTLVGAVVQAIVFCLLTTVYFALIFNHEE